MDFGLKLLGADLMSVPGLYRFVQVQLSMLIIIGSLSLSLDIPILAASSWNILLH